MRCEFCGIIEACCEGGPTDMPGIDFADGALYMAPRVNRLSIDQSMLR